VPTWSLPSDPSLVQLRKLARELQQRLRSGDPAALETGRQHYPDADLSKPALHVAQVIVARGFGFSSWPALVRHVETVQDLSRAPDLDRPVDDLAADDPAERFLRHAVLRYSQDDGPERWAVAGALLSEHPSISEWSIYAASATGNHAAVQRFLAIDRTLANRKGGPFGWEPLLYLTYARHDADISVGDVLTTAGLLLQAGADPNAGYLWHGAPTPFTALTGAFGSGEHGPNKQPPHPHWEKLARLLLEAGADPNDGQALYNCMFGPGDDHLELLFAFGLGSGDGGPWHRRFPKTTGDPAALLRHQLAWAVIHGMEDRIRLLAQHGVDVAAPLGGPLAIAGSVTPAELALTSGRPAIAALLVELGAPAQELDPGVRLAGALLSGDTPTVTALTIEFPHLLASLRIERPSLVLRAAAAGSMPGVRLLLECGFDVNAYGRQDVPVEQEWETALHYAAGEGDLELARVLLDAGADPNLLDNRFQSTPLGWAEFFERPQMADLLRRVTGPPVL
jgi:hypothetical protein